jgi:DUF2075 family protein
MRLYEGTIQEFMDDVIRSTIADKMAVKYKEFYRKEVNDSEYRSWQQSSNFLRNAFEFSKLTENKIILEHKLPYSDRRIDVILFGIEINGVASIVLIELKQWSNDNVEDCETEGNVVVNFGRFKKEFPHPSLQVEGYHWNLKDYYKIFEENPPTDLSSCVFCHNYLKKENAVLYLQKFERITNEYRVFSKQEVEELGSYLKGRLSNGTGLEVFNRFINSPIRPSKKLLEHTSEMINKQQVFTLIDDQIAAYNAIMHRAKKLSESKEKSVIIIKGGPGTGKSVIALEVMAELLRKGKNVYHATGSSAFTKTLRSILGKRSQERFKFFFHFTNHKDNELDVLICDEAHRIRKDSADYGVPYDLKSKNPQADDLVRSAKLAIFFIDEHQIVRPNEIGSVDLIRKSAEKFNAKIYEFELRTQFRCSGSDSFLQWLENILDIRESEMQILTKDNQMEFIIFDSPTEMQKAIEERNKEKPNCARIVAGFCWPWSKPNRDGTLKNDVVIGDFKMPWEKKDEFWKWATHDSGMEQVGTVYTAQGFEFDYIGVIFGNDLVYDKKRQTWMSKPENSYDSMVKRNNEMFTQHLKNVYRVLMSRAHKGVYVYFMGKDTENFFRSRIENRH